MDACCTATVTLLTAVPFLVPKKAPPSNVCKGQHDGINQQFGHNSNLSQISFRCTIFMKEMKFWCSVFYNNLLFLKNRKEMFRKFF